MNIKMLQFLVELSGKAVDVVDVDAFFRRFPKSAATLRDLQALKRFGYVSILDTEDGDVDG